MLLSELFGEDPLPMTKEEREVFSHATRLWNQKFDRIVKESKLPPIKTRIHVRKEKKNG